MKTCRVCTKDKLLSAFYKDNSKKDKLMTQCKDCFKNYENARKEQISATKKLYYIETQDIKKAYVSNYRKENSGKVNAINRLHNMLKKQRTPKWLTKVQIKEMQEFYILAKELQWLSKDKLEVDHIIPLNGKEVSGLHVPWNLQILPKSMNIAKFNKVAA